MIGRVPFRTVPTTSRYLKMPLSSSTVYFPIPVPLFMTHSSSKVPAILLASFAMQESSCNPSSVGEGGEQGLMQITKDKCKGAPNNDCLNPVSATRGNFLLPSPDASTRSGFQHPRWCLLLRWTTESEQRRCSVKHWPVQRLA
jgi:hypothetical protein